ncbi:IS21 family transposase [Kitasatospora sp. NPDC008050]|uniref:Mu transposase domain-containing protein n=1 Tax=Kitasatospora sp. NPDC008050 TaxID=3364021 RepID=UPI0036EEE937
MSLRFLPYCRRRLADDPHLPATALLAEVVELGYPGGYSTLTRAIRKHRMRPPCRWCGPGMSLDGRRSSDRADDEIRFAWLELADPSAQWGCGSRLHLLTGSLASSGRWRAVVAEGQDLPQLVAAVDQVMRRLGGTAPRWRLDRSMAACCVLNGRVTPAFAEVARYYGAGVDLSPAEEAGADGSEGGRAGAGDGSGADRAVALRAWWSSASHGAGLQAAQDDLDRLAARMDPRHRAVDGTPATLGEPAPPARGLLELPALPFPARVCVSRIVSPQGLVSFRGSFYAVHVDLAGAVVEVRQRLDKPYLSIATLNGAVIARHTLAPPGAGLTVVGRDHAIARDALERPARLPRAEAPACQGGKDRRPLSPAALAEAEALRTGSGG